MTPAMRTVLWPDYVPCEVCGHTHYDIANNWFVPCSDCHNGCERDNDEDYPQPQPRAHSARKEGQDEI